MSTKKNMLWIGAILIFVLSVVTFVAIPTAGGSSKSQTPVFGKWNGTPIEYVQDSFFLRQIQAISQQLQSQGQEVTQYNHYQVMQSAFNSAIVRLAMLEEIKSAGYKVPASIVNKNLLPFYQDENGKYSEKLYANTSESTRASRRASMTEDLTAQRYVEDVLGTQTGTYGLKTSSKETDLIKTMSSPERSFSYVSFAVSAYPESEAVAWAKSSQANADKFAKLSLSVITLDSETTAKKVAEKLAKGELKFDDAVATYSTRAGTDTAGKLADSYRYSVNALFADAKDLETVLALKPSAISSVVKAGSSFAIVRCDADSAQPNFDDPETAKAVAAYMKSNERGTVEDYFTAKAKDFVVQAKASGFDAACAAAGIEKKTTAAFGINYGNVSTLSPVPVDKNAELAGAEKSETFFKGAFSIPVGDVSDPILLGDNVVVLQPTEEKAIDQQMLEMVPLFYGYYASSWSQNTLTQAFFKSKKFEDNFMTTYLRYFLTE